MPFKFNPLTGNFDYYESGGGTPATTVTNETTWGISPAVGTATSYAREDHTHGSPTAPAGSGDVVGPSSAADSNFAAFDTTTGKLIKDSGSSAASFDAAGSAGAVQSNLTAHQGLTATVHGFDASGNAPAQSHDNGRHSKTFIATDTADYVYILQDVLNKLSSGLYTGGGLSIAVGNTTVDIASGTGVINNHAGTYQVVTFGAQNVSPAGNGTNYVAIASNGTANVSLTRQAQGSYIRLGHFFAQGGYVLEAFSVPDRAQNFMGLVMDWIGRGVGVLVESGLGVSEQGTALKLSIAPGIFHTKLGTYSTSTITTFKKMYNSSDNGWGEDTNNLNYVNVTQWNNVANPQSTALVTMTAGYWKKDLVMITPSGNAYYIFGQAEYSTQDLAKVGALPVIPAAIDEDGCYLVAIVCQKNDATIASRLNNICPCLGRVFGYGTGTTSTIVDHATLTNLSYAAAGHTGFAPSTDGVTNGNSHDHNGGDGGTIDHVNLNNKGTNTHAQIDTHLGASAPHSGHVQIGGQLGGTASSPDIRGVRETSGPTLLTLGAVADGQYFMRSGTTVVGGTPGAGPGGLTLTTVEVDLGYPAKRTGKFNITTTGLTSGRPVLIKQGNGPYTNKGLRTDTAQFDMIEVSGKTTSTTNIECFWKSNYHVGGNIKFDYAVG